MWCTICRLSIFNLQDLRPSLLLGCKGMKIFCISVPKLKPGFFWLVASILNLLAQEGMQLLFNRSFNSRTIKTIIRLHIMQLLHFVLNPLFHQVLLFTHPLFQYPSTTIKVSLNGLPRTLRSIFCMPHLLDKAFLFLVLRPTSLISKHLTFITSQFL